MGMLFAAHRLSRWKEWVTKDGEIIQFKMPSKVHDELSQRLARMVNERDKVGRSNVTATEATASMQVAITLVLCHGSDMRGFFFCRRAMSREGERVAANLGLGEWMIRRAREILEAVGFIERVDVATFTKWKRYDIEEGHHPERARRKPTKFQFGSFFNAWLSYASRKVRFRRSSLIQEGIIADSNSDSATPSTGRTGHLGERVITKSLKPRWRRDPEHRASQFSFPQLC